MSCECTRSGYFTVTVALFRSNEVTNVVFIEPFRTFFCASIVVEEILSLFYKTNTHSNSILTHRTYVHVSIVYECMYATSKASMMQLLHNIHFLSFGKPLYRVMLTLVQTIAYTILYRSFSRWTALCCCITDKQHTNFMTNCFYFCMLWVIWRVSNIQHNRLILSRSLCQAYLLYT